MNEKNSNITDFQAMQEERADGLQEKQKPEEELQTAKQERKEQLRKYIIFAVVMVVFGMVAFNAGQKSVRDEASAKITKMQDDANAKTAKLEQKLQQEYMDKKYALIEEQYENLTLLKEGQIEYCIELICWNHGKWFDLGADALDKLVLADVEYPPRFSKEIKEMNDEKALVYIDTLKEFAEKYPYSNDINHNIIYRMELLEEHSTEQLQKAETFEAIDALKKQCEANMALWEN